VDLDSLVDSIDRKELVELTRRLVRIPSVYRPGVSGEGEAASFVADYLDAMGLEPQWEEVEPGRPNVWAEVHGSTPGPCLLLEAHTDVVTEGDPGAWTYPPFEAILANGRIYGRGSADTKGNLAAAIMAVKALATHRGSWQGKVILCCPVDEEGMMKGIKRFIQAGHAGGVDAALICEPEENQVCVSQKGAMRATITVKGKMAHGAMPRSGINPIPRMARLLLAVEKMEEQQCREHGEHPHLGWPSLTPTIFRAPNNGEPQINVVPAEAYATLDIRTIPGQSDEALEARLRSILQEESLADPEFNATIEVIERRPWTETPMDHPLVKSVSEAVRRVLGRPPVYNGVPGATDGTFLHAWAGIPIVTTGAGGRLIPHQVDEYVEVDELVDASQIFAVAAALFLG